jgi:hypothetical protein
MCMLVERYQRFVTSLPVFSPCNLLFHPDGGGIVSTFLPDCMVSSARRHDHIYSNENVDYQFCLVYTHLLANGYLNFYVVR